MALSILPGSEHKGCDTLVSDGIHSAEMNCIPCILFSDLRDSVFLPATSLERL